MEVKNYFEVNVTPERKRKALPDPSPVLILEKFKGTPSLSFKDVKTGTSSIKGLWIENPNDFIITVEFLNLPSVEHGLTVTEREFTLEAKASNRVAVKFTPKCEGSWREVVHVKVWGLPPPHLNFRLVIHLSSVKPKIKQKCCEMALPPLRSHNSRVMKTQQGTRAKQTAKPKSCCQKHIKEVAVKCFKSMSSKENQPKEAKLVIGQYGAERKPGMDRDSLEGDGLPNSHQFTRLEGDELPPCDVPSTPIRRTTYQVRAEDRLDPNSPHRILPSTARTFTVLEDEQAKSAKFKFIDALDSISFSPTTTVNQCAWIEKEHRKDIDIPFPTNRPNTLFENVDEEDNKARCMPNQSSPLIYGAACPLITPATSPIRYFGQNSFHGVGCHDAERGPFSTIVNATYIKESNYELINAEGSENACFEKQLVCGKLKVERPEIEEVARNLELREKACCLIQRNWRRVKAERKVARLLAERLEIMNKACTVIQKYWRMLLAMRLAKRLRSERLEIVNRSTIVIQKNWRMVLAMRLAEKLRSEKFEMMNRAATVIQKNWRTVLAMRLAEKLRSERREMMNRSATVIQKNWRMVLAMRLAEKLRSERHEMMNRSATVIQKNWRTVLAMRLAEKLRSERREMMNRSATVIQKNWRMVLAMRLAEKLRSERREMMNRSATVIQKNWRMVLAMRLAEKLRSERHEMMNRSATVIQKNWRMVLAMRLAEKLRSERREMMNRSATVIQKNWRMVLAMRLAEKLRSERHEMMNRSATVIQKNWRMVLAMRLAEKLRSERHEMMNRSATVIQKNWRTVLAMRLAEKLRSERHEMMNRSATVIQKNWRTVLAMRLAEKLRSERREMMNRSATLIQKNWRMVLAMRLAEKLRSERHKMMNRSATVIQKNWRTVLAMRLAEKLRSERREMMNRSATVIQKNWRMVLAMRLAEKLRSDKVEMMKRASTVIQRNWRIVQAKRLAETLRSDGLEMISRASTTNQKNSRNVLAKGNIADVEPSPNDRYCGVKQFKVPEFTVSTASGNAKLNESFAAANSTMATSLSSKSENKFLTKVCENYSLQPRVCRVLCELAASDAESIHHALRHIREGMQSGKVQPGWMEFGKVDKSTQTDKTPVQFTKPQVQSLRKVVNVSSESKVKCHGRRSLGGPNLRSRRVLELSERSISPVKRRNAKEDMWEKERWANVAEAVSMGKSSNRCSGSNNVI